MSKIKIITNHHWRKFMYFHELTDEEKKELDWVYTSDVIDDPDTLIVFRYRGNVYTLEDFIPTTADTPPLFPGWDGYASDSFFSGVLIKLSDDCEEYKIATYIS